MSWMPLLAVLAGMLISVQAALNARLGVLLQNPLLATTIALGVAFVMCLTLSLSTLTSLSLGHSLGNSQRLFIHDVTAIVPPYLWFTGGLLSAMGVGLLYFLIPKIGMSTMTVMSLSGQLAIASIAGHFGWFDLPETPFTLQKTIGFILLLSGVVLVSGETFHAH